MDHDLDEYLTTALLRQRYKKSSKTIREWELSGILPAPTRIGSRKYWKRSLLEQAEREGMSRRKPETVDA